MSKQSENNTERKESEVINGMKIPLKDVQKRLAPKRFYESVFVEEAEDVQGFCVKLDQRILKSPEKVKLVWASRDLAQRIAQEWDFQKEAIYLHDMPLTLLSYSSIGRDKAIYEELRTEMLSYAGSDLIVYRATRPPELIAQQKHAWMPVLDWLEQDFGASFKTVEGISFITQPKASLKQIELYLRRVSDEHLAGLMAMTKLSGSVFLAMSVREKFSDAAGAWERAMVDENWQNSQWGQDEAQKQKLLMMRRDFSAAADFIKLH